MTTATTTKRDALLADLEDLWRCLDELFDSLGANDWSRRHGKDWTFADVPYHLAYFDREMVLLAVERGTDVPAEEQVPYRTMKQLNDWNAREFAKRPAGQTPQQSVEQMRATHDAIRATVSQFTDDDLTRLVWSPLPGMGWITIEAGLEGLRAHTWGHFMQLRLYMKRSTPVTTPAVTHGALAFYTGLMPMMMDRKRAAGADFTMTMEITGPGGGAWSYYVKDGTCTCTEARAERPDLVLSQSAETFIKTFAHMHNPMVAMLTRKIRVRGLRKMPTFAKLFPPESEDMVFEGQG